MDSSIEKTFSQVLSADKIKEVMENYNRQMSGMSRLRTVAPDRARTDDFLPIDSNDLGKDEFMARVQSFVGNVTPRFPPLKVLPCANAEVSKHYTCPNPGKLVCSRCRLVSYCSKSCQKNHWSEHKLDCKSPMLSPDWKPAWTREGRCPSFITDSPDVPHWDPVSTGLSLWGNMPAVDVINLSANEQDPTRDFSLAFIASGDLRNVLLTVNSLPQNYSGHLNILLNDGSLPTAFRNMVLILVLGTIEDESLAADIALHFWYSAFLPMEYRIRITATAMNAIKNVFQTHRLGPNSTLQSFFQPNNKSYFSHLFSQSLSVHEAQEEYDRVRSLPHRKDFQDRMYLLLRPSHRVAYSQFRRFGLVLPFGAINAHFNVPNNSLFMPGGKWAQTDYADPLHGWEWVSVFKSSFFPHSLVNSINAVIRAGKAHNATPEDIYGCLYFFLSDHLRMFSRRLRQFRMSFKVTNAEATELAKAIRDNTFSEVVGLTSSARFDRIEVSNILDANYVGIRDVLTHWAPLLSDSKTAAIVGYFMNWVMHVSNGQARDAGEATVEKIFKRLSEEGRIPGLSMLEGLRPRKTSAAALQRQFEEIQASIIGAMTHIEALYENWKPFSEFLGKEGLAQVLNETDLVLRNKHTIVPHRICAPLTGPPDGLPKFGDDEDWYRQHELACFTFTERYVEFVRA